MPPVAKFPAIVTKKSRDSHPKIPRFSHQIAGFFIKNRGKNFENRGKTYNGAHSFPPSRGLFPISAAHLLTQKRRYDVATWEIISKLYE